MAVDIIMPRLGLTMEEGTIVRWHAAAGERVAQGRPLLEVETDKVTVEVEAPATGVMEAPLVSAGEKAPVGALIGRLLEPDEIPRRVEDDTRKDIEEKRNRITPLARRIAEQERIDLAAGASSTPHGRVTAEDVRAASSRTSTPETVRVFSSPRARKQARARGVDWRALPGSGPRGRVIERDVLGVAAGTPAISAPIVLLSPPPVGSEEVRWVTPTAAQRIAADRMTASFGSAPHFYLDVEAQADALLAMYEQLLAAVERKRSVRLTLTDLLVRIAGAALAEHPRANAFWADGRIGLYGRVNVGIAVATGDSTPRSTGGGLVVPVLRDVDRKPLAQIAAERVALVARARAGQLSPDDLTGGTFTLTNLGMYRVDSFQAILNPPQSAILAVGRIAERPVAIGGQLAVRRTMVLSLSCDHRVLDGVLGAQFLGRVAELIEEPYELLYPGDPACGPTANNATAPEARWTRPW